MLSNETLELITIIGALFPNFKLDENGVEAWENEFAKYDFEFSHARKALSRIIASGNIIGFAPNISQIIAWSIAIYQHEQKEKRYRNSTVSSKTMSDKEWEAMQKKIDNSPARKALMAKFGFYEH